MGKPPQFLFPGVRNRDRWTRRARLVLEAFQQFEDSLCPSCGQSGIHALNIAHSRRYVAVTGTCLGCAAREGFAKNNEGAAPEHGLKVFVENRMAADIETDWE